jgi:hypothetical protein
MIASMSLLLPAKKDGFLASGEGEGGARRESPEGAPCSAVSGGEVAVTPELK